MRPAALAAFLSLIVASPALADAPIATAGGAPAAPQPSTPPPPLQDAGPALANRPPMAMGPCGPEKVRPDGSLATTPHGEVDGGVGSYGFRHLGGAICQPIGQNAAVALRIDQGQGGFGGYGR